ncbi:hypothetical protein C2845_PM05G34450 [Panicum miliaceum]|uniref:Uncharacterized protein n=1 Tax=Panicum miliaceum TaxID=4540 RepID=A0A3L6SYC0_PANMI|nr:hypothetical protein C2845_PM05G34450 [Panicum miliaceum]
MDEFNFQQWCIFFGFTFEFILFGKREYPTLESWLRHWPPAGLLGSARTGPRSTARRGEGGEGDRAALGGRGRRAAR